MKIWDRLYSSAPKILEKFERNVMEILKNHLHRGDTELLSLHTIRAHNASNRKKKKKQCILWFITYSLLHTIRRYSQTPTKPLFHEKFRILRNIAKTRLQTICHRQQFLRATCEFILSNEKCLRILFKYRSAKQRQCRAQNEKLVREISSKMLYTLFAEWKTCSWNIIENAVHTIRVL